MAMRPFPGFSSELLAQIAQAAFRPPQGMQGGAPGLPGMQAPQGGMGLGQGMAGLGMGLANWRPGEITNAGPQGSGAGGAYTTADAMGMAGLGGGADGQLLSPMNPSFGDLGGPGMSGGAGGGFWPWLKGLI